MVALRDLIVQLPDGTHRLINVDVNCLACDVLSALNCSATLFGSGRVFNCNDAIPSHVTRLTASFSLRGGKGGFGALLRGGPGGLHMKKTTNFDACRDLSGRRLRHAKAEERLRAWALKQAEREKQKEEEKAAKRTKNQEKKQAVAQAFAEESSKLQQATQNALSKGLERSKHVQISQAKRAAKRENASKKAAEWDILMIGDDDDEGEDDEGVDVDVDEKKAEEQEEEEDYTIFDEGYVTCDVCNKQIVGRRWHSVHREDYDLCDACHTEQKNGEDTYILVMQTAPQTHDEEEASTKRQKVNDDDQ